jgi:hypothetical protein
MEATGKARTVKQFIDRGRNAQKAVDKIMAKNGDKPAAKKPEPKKAKVFAPVEVDSIIRTTTEYDKFKRMPGNRPIKPHHVEEVKKKIMEKDLRTPIVINKDWQVIDGQHSLEARRMLGLDVPYRFGSELDLHDVQTLNSTSLPWTNDDYAHSYIEQGNTHYKTYRAFRNKYNLQHEAAMMLLSGRDMSAMRKVFRTGQFRVANLKDAEFKADMFAQLQEFIGQHRPDVFLKAFLIALNRVGFTFDRFIERARENKRMFSYWPTIDDNLLMIEEVYNAGAGKKVAIRYGERADKVKPGRTTKESKNRIGWSREDKIDKVVDIEQLILGGIPMTQACEREGLPESTFYAWRTKFAKEVKGKLAARAES